MKKGVLISFDAAVVAAVVYSLLVVDFWPTSAAGHIALACSGLTYPDVAFHPVWCAVVRHYGLSAAAFSILCGSVAVGLWTGLAIRFCGRVAGCVSGACFMLSASVLCSATRVGWVMFDWALILIAACLLSRHVRGLLALPAAGLVLYDLVAAAFANPRSLLLDGTVGAALLSALVALLTGFAVKGMKPDGVESKRTTIRKIAARTILVVIAVASPVYFVANVFSPRLRAGGLGDAVVRHVLSQVTDETQWIVTDAALEDSFVVALSRRDAKKRPFLVRAGRNFDDRHLADIRRRVERDYPDDVQLRTAASLSVRSFLEELPFVETNRQAVVFAWGREVWTPEAVELKRKEWARWIADADEPLAGYVDVRLGVGRGSNGAVTMRSARARTVRRGARTVRCGGRTVRCGARVADCLRQRILVLSNNWSRVTSTLVDCIRQDDMEAVWNCARQIVCEDRTNPLGNAILGTMVAASGDYSGAELFLRRAAASQDASPLVLNDLAETLRRLGKFDDAERAARLAVTRMPGNWRVWETLADVLLSKGAAVAEAQEAVERAESLAEKVPEENRKTLMFLRGWLELKLGHRETAQRIFRRLKNGRATEEIRARVDAVGAGTFFMRVKTEE